jgi:hypothetical protein
MLKGVGSYVNLDIDGGGNIILVTRLRPAELVWIVRKTLGELYPEKLLTSAESDGNMVRSKVHLEVTVGGTATGDRSYISKIQEFSVSTLHLFYVPEGTKTYLVVYNCSKLSVHMQKVMHSIVSNPHATCRAILVYDNSFDVIPEMDLHCRVQRVPLPAESTLIRFYHEHLRERVRQSERAAIPLAALERIAREARGSFHVFAWLVIIEASLGGGPYVDPWKARIDPLFDEAVDASKIGIDAGGIRSVLSDVFVSNIEFSAVMAHLFERSLDAFASDERLADVVEYACDIEARAGCTRFIVHVECFILYLKNKICDI